MSVKLQWWETDVWLHLYNAYKTVRNLTKEQRTYADKSRKMKRD